MKKISVTLTRLIGSPKEFNNLQVYDSISYDVTGDLPGNTRLKSTSVPILT